MISRTKAMTKRAITIDDMRQHVEQLLKQIEDNGQPGDLAVFLDRRPR